MLKPGQQMISRQQYHDTLPDQFVITKAASVAVFDKRLGHVKPNRESLSGGFSLSSWEQVLYRFSILDQLVR